MVIHCRGLSGAVSGVCVAIMDVNATAYFSKWVGPSQYRAKPYPVAKGSGMKVALLR